MNSMNRHLFAIAATASLGGLLFGFDTAVIAGTTHELTTTYQLSSGLLGITVSSALGGTILGAAMAGTASDRFGRRKCLSALGLIYVASALGCALAWGWIPLLAFRVLCGLAIGGSSVISPTYVAEMSPPKLRGRLVGMFQFNVVVGILLAYLSNYLIGSVNHATAAWRWKLGIAALPAAIFSLALLYIPESPRWLLSAGRREEALGVLRRNGELEPEAEIEEIQRTLNDEQGSDSESVLQRRYLYPICLAVTIGAFNQLSGINAILYYLNSIFESAGFDSVSSNLQAVLIGLTNLVGVIIALTVIDRLGRRQMLLIGSVGTAICMTGVATVFWLHRGQSALLWLLIGFIAFFSFSQGAVIWVYISEVFPNRVRAKGQSIGSFTHWFMNAVVSALFPVVAAVSGGSALLFLRGHDGAPIRSGLPLFSRDSRCCSRSDARTPARAGEANLMAHSGSREAPQTESTCTLRRNNRMSSKKPGLALAKILLIATGIAIAASMQQAMGQTNLGSVVGTVTDTTGATVPGAKVVPRNDGTNQTVTVATNQLGSVTFQNLNPGS